MFCRNCGKELTGTPEICLGCGAKPLAGTSFCNACGAQTNSLAEICVKCGARLGKAKAMTMHKREPLLVFFLAIITFGIYGLVWYVWTKHEMKRAGAQIPTCWLLIIPFVNWYWMWKFSQGVEMVTNKEMSAGAAFLLIFFLGVIGMAIVQSSLNKVAT